MIRRAISPRLAMSSFFMGVAYISFSRTKPTTLVRSPP